MAGLIGITPKHLVEADPLQRFKARWPEGLPIVRPMYHMPVLFGGASEPGWRDARFGISRTFSSFNARSENFTESKLWKSLFGKWHAAVALSYIVEWREEKGERAPYLISRADGHVMWTPALTAPCFDDKSDVGFAIATRSPNGFFKHFHDRMVGVMDEAGRERWLAPTKHSPSELMECVRAPDEDELVAVKAVGQLMKRDAEDLSPIKTTGEKITIQVLEGKKAAKGAKQAKLGA